VAQHEMTQVAFLHRTLDQELAALLRGASLECLVCGEFVMHARGSIFCPECGSQLADEDALESELPNAALECTVQAG
jgi:Zn finger protein HypA/HybF involved in hydrogenase expression